ncbi:DUF1127 domain-containing protein [Tabrizicola sp.]|uniref:DUF1127 domain-containing protein n=1 Tax=Tabrizicola sp. TaxID=2005166 RepID=UPI00261D8E83|nr:DUF1127 domain-containing protein [Tabrizicola sp.]MDM7932835.1 DUF1127 domain-containing protein [Tabrizicola sp.]
MSAKALSIPLIRLLSPRPVAGLWRLIALSRSRRHLARLDDHLLRDIGLSRAEAEAEVARPVWDAPPHWHRDNV